MTAIDTTGTELTLHDHALHPMPMSVDEARQAMAQYQEMCKALLEPDDGHGGGDLQRIRDKDHPKRSAMQKLAAAYGVSTEIVSEQIDYDDQGNVLRAKITARAIHPSGRHADGDGTCSVKESRFRKNPDRIDHDVRSTAVTRAKNRAIGDCIAFGAVTAEELEGTGHGSTTSTPAGEWAQPVNDISGVAAAITELFKLVDHADPEGATGRIGQQIFDACGDTIPMVAWQTINFIADEIRLGGVKDGDTAEAGAGNENSAPADADQDQTIN